jgi:hypothetical protein
VNHTTAWESVAEAEALGIRFRLIGDRIRATLPGEHPDRLADVIERLRANREEVAELLQKRATVPTMPQGVKLVVWNPKEPPVAIETCSVVVDVSLFIRSTLAQLGAALENEKRWLGWSVPQLTDRLRLVGVVVEVETILSVSRVRVPRFPKNARRIR